MKILVLVIGLGLFAAQASAMEVEGVNAQALGSTQVLVSWNSAPGAAYYDLYQDSTRVDTGLTDTVTQVSGLQADTRYQFFVTACTADGICSEASPQANVMTEAGEGSNGLGVCEPATDGTAPVVELQLVDDATAVLSWCEVSGAEGYNLFLNNEYQSTFGPATRSTTVSFSGTEQYQIAWYGNGNFPAKSAVAESPDTDTPVAPPGTDTDALAALESASSSSDDDVEIYFTRHAEKQTVLEEQEDGSFIEVCGTKNCAEELNAKGELRAELLADIFNNAGITARLTHAFSSHKIRTRQTIEMITADAGLTGDDDKNPNDGIQEFPVLNSDGTGPAAELNPEGTSASEAPVIESLLNLPPGSVALVAGHSGTLYDIMAGIGLTDVCLEATIDSCNQDRYPVNSDFKVRNFGDVWKVTLVDGVANFIYRVNLQPLELDLNELAQ